MAVLRDTSSVRVGADALSFLAQTHDQQCSRTGPDAAWAAVVLDRIGHPERYTEYDGKVRQFMAHLQGGHAQEALALGIIAIPHDVPGAALAIEAHRLSGIGLVLAGRPQEAIGSFQSALRLARNAHPYQAANLLLLLSDAQRRAGDAQAAAATWQAAVETASELAIAPNPVLDPILWEHAGYLRPVDTAWPAPVRRRLAEVQVGFGIVSPASNQVGPGATMPSATDEMRRVDLHWPLATFT